MIVGARFLFLCASVAATAAVYQVGPGKPLSSIGQVPWATLQPGDQVWIYWRSTPYREKWVIARSGTAAQRILIRGIAGPSGQKPIIDGNGAVTAPGLDYWSEERGVVKFGGSSVPSSASVSYVTLDGLDIRNGYPGYQFRNDRGALTGYSNNAASIYLERGENIVIRNCILQGSANGLFIASATSSVSRNILVEHNQIYGNGRPGSAYEHNIYTSALGIVFQFNYLGPPRAGSIANNLKDRSAGLVVRYNWIEGGNRQLDLVDAYGLPLLTGDPGYPSTFVYGNILVENNTADNSQIIHYGGDSGQLSGYRRGTLYLYCNTVVSRRTGNTTLARLSSTQERMDARNNIVFSVGPLAILDGAGLADLTTNWLKSGWRASFSSGLNSNVTDRGGNRTGSEPGFVNAGAADYRLTASSPCVNTGGPQHAYTQPAHAVLYEYTGRAGQTPRPNDGQLDLGAFERRSSTSTAGSDRE